MKPLEYTTRLLKSLKRGLPLALALGASAVTGREVKAQAPPPGFALPGYGVGRPAAGGSCPPGAGLYAPPPMYPPGQAYPPMMSPFQSAPGVGSRAQDGGTGRTQQPGDSQQPGAQQQPDAQQNGQQQPGAQQDGQQQMQADLGSAQQNQSPFGQGAGAASGASSQAASSTGAAPNMIGDFFGTGSSCVVITPPGTRPSARFAIPGPTDSLLGRQKLADNTSAIPQDRFFADYTYFNEVPLDADGVDVHRVAPGFEKTLFDGMASFEVQFPVGSSIDNVINGSLEGNQPIGGTDQSDLQIGDVNLVYKSLVYRDAFNYATAGVAVSLPTGDGIEFFQPGVGNRFSIDNESWHILPFVAVLRAAPSGRGWFQQAFLQLDLNAGDDTVLGDTPAGFREVGEIDGPAFVYLDLSYGYRHVRNVFGNPLIRAVTPSMELHFNQSIEETDSFTFVSFGDVITIGKQKDNISIINGTLGLTLECAHASSITLAYGFPLTNDSDTQMDGEFRLTFTKFFGRTARNMRGDDRVFAGR